MSQHPADRLAAFLVLAGRSRRQIAIAELEVDPSYLTHLAAGRMRPGLRVAAAIERLTRGAPGGPIKAEDWLTVDVDAVVRKGRPRSATARDTRAARARVGAG